MLNLEFTSSYQNPEGKLADRLAPRTNMKKRLDMLSPGLFYGKTVLDIGCNNGYFVRAALNMGAKRAVGVDISDCITGARALAANERLKNAEFWQTSADSKEFRRFCPKFDTVLFLSVLTHLRDKDEFLDWLDGIVGHTLVFESNHGEKNKAHIELVKKHIYFDSIEYLGTTDIPSKPHHLWICKKPSHPERYSCLKNIQPEFVALDKIKGWDENKIFNQKTSYSLTSEKYLSLKADIKARGFREPIVLQEYKGELLGFNGIHRYFVAKELGYKDVPAQVMRGMVFTHLGQKHES